MKKIALLILSIFLFITLNTNQTFACSCMINQSPSISMEKATSVFIGKVTKIEESSIVNNLVDYKKNYVTFSVSSNIKGNSDNEITIVTAKDSATCGYNFDEEKEYIVYTYGDENKQEVSLCSRTTLLTDANEDLEILKDKIVNIKEKNEVNIKRNFKEIFISIFLIIITIVTIIFITKPIKTKK
ncbi:MAG: hypothetical protein PHI37_03310 [Candidatus Gracilibacteria bacterium]|nr:hypothetical protein [Candidatus Gracilibacteria bacterium]